MPCYKGGWSQSYEHSTTVMNSHKGEHLIGKTHKQIHQDINCGAICDGDYKKHKKIFGDHRQLLSVT